MILRKSIAFWRMAQSGQVPLPSLCWRKLKRLLASFKASLTGALGIPSISYEESLDISDLEHTTAANHVYENQRT
jgi:hypothetical protein